MMRAFLSVPGALVALLTARGPAWACASCLASAYGDRTFNWAMLGLILMPFAVGAVIAGVLWARLRHAGRPGPQSQPIEENA